MKSLRQVFGLSNTVAMAAAPVESRPILPLVTVKVRVRNHTQNKTHKRRVRMQKASRRNNW